jgi:hypothetical protein
VSSLHSNDNRVVQRRHAYPDANFDGQTYAYTASSWSAEAAPDAATSPDTSTATTFATPYSMAATHSAASPNTGAHSLFATPHSSTAAIANL